MIVYFLKTLDYFYIILIDIYFLAYDFKLKFIYNLNYLFNNLFNILLNI